MRHAEVIDALYEVTRRIDSGGGDAADVIMKYASENSLAPEQLRRLGQMYNTASTLAVFETEDRGGTPHLVDVPSLVESYVEKKASVELSGLADTNGVYSLSVDGKVSFMPSGDKKIAERGEDGTWDFEKVAWDKPKKKKAEPAETGGIPDVWNPRPKLVLDESPDPFVVNGKKHLFKSAFSLADREVNLTLDALEEVSVEPRGLMTQLVKMARVSGNPAQFARQLQIDAHGYLDNPVADFLGDHVLKALEAEGFSVKQATEEEIAEVAIHRDNTGAIPLLEKLAANLELTKKLEKYGREIAVGLAGMVEAHEEKMDDYCAERMEKILDRFGVAKEAAGPGAGGGGRPVPKPSAPSYDPAGDGGVKKKKKDEGSPGSDSDVWEKTLPRQADTFSKFFYDMVAKKPMESWDLLEDELAMNNQKERLREAGSLDRALLDTRSVANLQRLMVQDEIISERDPEEVVSLFNSLRTSSPEIASDYNLLRLTLRNALETQGLDVDTAKATAEAEAQIRFNRGELQSPKPSRKRDGD